MLNEIYNTAETKTSFLKGLINLAKVDGEIEESEITILKNVAISMGLDDRTISLIEALAESSENVIDLRFDNKKQALLLIREGIQLCHVDGKYDVKEREMIRELSSHLNVSERSIVEIEDWVRRGIEWSNSGLKLLELEV